MIPTGNAVQPVTFYRVVCSVCSKRTDTRENPYDAIRVAENTGWIVSDDRDRAVCFDCSKKGYRP